MSYGSSPVLADVGLTVAEGKGLCITGENGIGKSTLLRCILGLQKPDKGDIEVFGGPPGSTPEFWRAVSATVEPPTWYPGLTCREHAELVCRAHGVDAEESGVDEALERLGLADHADAIPLSMSSGQKQRLTLVLAFLRPSRLMILDEPEQRLDAEGRDTVAALLTEYLAGGNSFLMASHDEKFVTASGARAVSMDEL